MRNPQKEKWIIGIDEVGRGPLAGPVTVCALAMRADGSQASRGPGSLTSGSGRVRDSKQLSAKQREAKLRELKKLRAQGKIDWRVASVSHKIIDRKGIVFATSLALTRALTRLHTSLGARSSKLQILLDGGLRAPKEFKNQRTIIRGDATVPVIGLASIVAKVHRDRLMIHLGVRHPSWGFAQHKGYGTRAHYRALTKFGPSTIHRLSFL